MTVGRCECRFAKVKSLISSRDFKAGVVAYNKLARTLTEFQILWHASWLKSLEASCSGLQQNLLAVHPETGETKNRIVAGIGSFK